MHMNIGGEGGIENEECLKLFSRKSALVLHMRINMGEKPFPKFANSKNHIRTRTVKTINVY